MALSAATVWEVRAGATGASANNGGGFVAGASGTDFSQQNSPQYNAADLAGTNANTASPTVTSATHNFVATDVGNIIHITAGTNWTAGFYQIVSCAANAATLDRACASVASPTSGTYAVGGALTSIANVGASVVAGNTIWQKNTGNTDTLAGALTITIGTVTAPVWWFGYNSARGDLHNTSYASSHGADGFLTTTNFPVVACQTNTLTTNSFNIVACLSFTGTKTAGTQLTTGNASVIYRCKCAFTGAGAVNGIGPSSGSVIDCDISAVTASGSASISTASGSSIIGNRITCTAGGCVAVTSNSFIAFNTFYATTGSETAIRMAGAGSISTIVVNNTFDNIAGTCLTIPDSAQTAPIVLALNNQVTNCGTFCNNLHSATQAVALFAALNRIRNTSTSYTGWYSNTSLSDITTSQTDANEYVNQAAANFFLKFAAVGKTGGFGNLDIGAFQRTEPALPSINDVRNAVTFGSAGGADSLTGLVVVPSSNDVRNGTTFDTASTGNLVSPVIGNVRSGITFGSLSSLTGTLIVPAVGNVRLGTNFDTSSTGTLRVPSVNDVRNGTSFDVSSTGVLVLPATTDVANGVHYGANGTEFTGSLSGGSNGFPLGG